MWVANGENVCFKLALKQGFSALVTVISLIYSAVCVAGSCLDLQKPAVESIILLRWAQFLSSTDFLLVFLRRNAPRHGVAFLPNPRSTVCVLWLVLDRIFSSRSRRGAQGEAALLVGFVIVFSDSDRVGRGEWSRVYDACMVVRVYLSGLRAPCMPRRCLRRLETRHPYHLGGVFWYGSSISIIIYLSLIRGISSVADGKNSDYALRAMQGCKAGGSP